MIDTYICGCDPEEMKNYAFHMLPNGIPTNKRYDKEGYEVCPWHGERLYGWNSPQVQNIPDRREHDYSQHRGKPLNLDWEKIKNNPDTRDNRDPEEIGLALLAERKADKANRNGHENN